ncbi:MAG: proton-conducting transporter membrane subunit [Kiritimatiellia bacterium]
MNLLLASLVIWIAGGGVCLLAGRNRRVAGWIGAGAAVAGSALALAACLSWLIGSHGATWQVELSWSMPFGWLVFSCDGLAALFVFATAWVTALAAIYGVGYLRHAPAGRPFGLAWCLFNLLTASMVGVFLAANAMLFLLSWEVMALTSFGLVMFDHERPGVRRAAVIYFVATHLGTALLLVMFLLLGREAGGSLDFCDLRDVVLGPELAGAVFVLALMGFGTKAGLMPMHVWLPEAHPAAPSHVSAVMSGVMIKTGIYGIARIISWLGCPPPGWGWTLVVLGAVSGVLGILFALAQRDLKRMLAYSSVENVGIITMGLGIGLLGMTAGSPVMSTLGFAGALLHVLNHALFKSLLFLNAGAVLQATGTAEIDRQGGLLRRMPVTGNTFLVGAAAIAGLPPCNGFVGEILVFLGALTPLLDVVAGGPTFALAGGLVAAVALAVIGTLAVACFAKAFGMVFLGEPREAERAGAAQEVTGSMRLPMLLLAGSCMGVGLMAPWLFQAVIPAVYVLAGGSGGMEEAGVAGSQVVYALQMVSLLSAGVLLLALLLFALRRALLRGRVEGSTVTWDCGYAAPTARMQYTASSFAQPILQLMRHVMMARRRFTPPRGLFPGQAAFASETPDVYQERLYRPLFEKIETLIGRMQWMQHGKLNYYILAIVLALLVLLAWKMR